MEGHGKRMRGGRETGSDCYTTKSRAVVCAAFPNQGPTRVKRDGQEELGRWARGYLPGSSGLVTARGLYFRSWTSVFCA